MHVEQVRGSLQESDINPGLCSSWGPSHIPQGDGSITGQLAAAAQQEGSCVEVLLSSRPTCGLLKTNICFTWEVVLGATLGEKAGFLCNIRKKTAVFPL